LLNLSHDLLDGDTEAESLLLDADQSLSTAVVEPTSARVAAASQALGKLQLISASLAEVKNDLYKLNDDPDGPDVLGDIKLLEVVVEPSLAAIDAALRSLLTPLDVQQARDAIAELNTNRGLLKRVLTSARTEGLIKVLNLMLLAINTAQEAGLS